MRKRLLSFLLTLLIPITLIGCMPSGTKLYTIYRMSGGSGPDIFLDSTPTADQIPDTGNGETPEDPAQTREILFMKHLYPLQFEEDPSGDYYVYTGNAGKLTCHFASNGGMLRMLAAESWLAPEKAAAMSEDDYLNWIKEQVSVYYTEDWTQYTLSCTTQIRDSFYGKDSVHKENGFVTPVDSYESVDSYTFTFTKYLGEYTTTDLIRAHIRPQTGYTSLEFSPHDFDNSQAVKVDHELILASIFQFLSDSIGKSQYSYTKHSSKNPTLTYIKGHLTYLCTIQIDVTSLNENDKFESESVLQPVAILLQ